MSSTLSDLMRNEIIHLVCRENVYLRQEAQKIPSLEEDIKFWKQSLSEKTQHLQRAQHKIINIEASANNMHFQLRQQTAMTVTIKEQNMEISKSLERAVQERTLVEEQLETERHEHAQLVNFIGALNFMRPEELENLLGHKVAFDGILASHPKVARQMETWERASAAKDEIVEKCKTLLNLLGECDNG